LARSQPGKLAYASAGVGSVSHLMGEQFKLATKTDILHVPYRGVAPALNDAIAGQVQIMFDNLPTS
jgi:tripartite-type tricarboxylate transporter receptor subunit TctC